MKDLFFLFLLTHLLNFTIAHSTCSSSDLFNQIQSDVLSHTYSELATGEVTYQNELSTKVFQGTDNIFNEAYRLITNANEQILYQTWNFDKESRPARYLSLAIQELGRRLRQSNNKAVTIWLMFNVTALQNYQEKRQEIIDFIKDNNLNNQYVNVRAGIFRAHLLGANHVKNLIIDNQYGLVTGANTSHHFNKRGLFDAGFSIAGSSVHTMSKDFIQLWQNRFAGKATPLQLADKPSATCNPILFTRSKPHGNFLSSIQKSSINYAFLYSLERAQHKIDIFTPSLNVQILINAIERAVKRGVQVRIILSKKYEEFLQSLPTRGGTNQFHVEKIKERLSLHLDSETLSERLQMKWYSSDGLKPALTAKGSNSHVKFLTIDDQITYIGSANMDRQSWVNSREIGLFIDNRELSLSWGKQLFEPAFERAFFVE